MAEVIKEFKLLGLIEAWEERIVICQEIEDRLKKYLDLADLYNTREEVISFAPCWHLMMASKPPVYLRFRF